MLGSPESVCLPVCLFAHAEVLSGILMGGHVSHLYLLQVPLLQMAQVCGFFLLLVVLGRHHSEVAQKTTFENHHGKIGRRKGFFSRPSFSVCVHEM